jgi:hypothetical protein
MLHSAFLWQMTCLYADAEGMHSANGQSKLCIREAEQASTFHHLESLPKPASALFLSLSLADSRAAK